MTDYECRGKTVPFGPEIDCVGYSANGAKMREFEHCLLKNCEDIEWLGFGVMYFDQIVCHSYFRTSNLSNLDMEICKNRTHCMFQNQKYVIHFAHSF